MTTVIIAKDTNDGETVILERSEFATEQEAMEYATITRRAYDNTPAGSGADKIRVTISS